MNKWNQVVSYGVMALTMIAFSASAQQQNGNREGRQRMSPEERAKITATALPITATAVAEYVKLDEAKTKAFVKAYVAANEAASKRMADLRQGGGQQMDRQAMMDAMQKSRDEMAKVLKDNMTEEQAKKVNEVIGGRFSSLDRNVESLVRAKVEEAKIKKAMPVLIKYAADNNKMMMTEMRGQSGAGEGAGAGGFARPSDEMMTKMREMREKLVKDLTPIVGEEAATSMGGRGMRMGGGMRQGQ